MNGLRTIYMAIIIMAISATGTLAQLENADFWGTPDGVSAVEYADGTIWVGGNSGISAIDETTLEKTRYNFAGSDLVNETVRALALDDSVVWIGAGGTLQKFDGTTWETRSDADYGLSDATINALAWSDETELWIATDLGLANYKTDDSYTVLTSSNSELKDDVINDVWTNGDSTWVATEKGAALILGDTVHSHYLWNNGSDYLAVYSGAIDESGNVWFGVRDSVMKLSGATEEWFAHNNGNTNDLDFDNAGDVWAAAQSGAFVMDGGELVEKESAMLIPYTSIACDDQGKVWRGGGGVYSFTTDSFDDNFRYYESGSWTTYQAFLGNYGGSGDFFDLFVDPKTKEVYISTGFGAYYIVLADGEWSFYDAGQSCPSESFRSMTLDLDGNFWGGLYECGLVFYDGSDYTLYDSASGALASDNVTDIDVDSAGNFWAATAHMAGVQDVGGVSIFNGVDWEIQTMYDSQLPSTQFLSLAVDTSGTVWAGSQNGLARHEGDTLWTVFDASNSNLPASNITHIEPTPDGGLWIACGGKYFARYDGTDFTAYTPSGSPIPDQNVGEIAVDETGTMWAVYQDRMLKFDGTDAEVFMASNTVTIKEAAGDSPYFARVAADRDGRVYVALLNAGILSFDVESLTPVELTAFAASFVEGAVELTWTTASEIDAKRFEIERRDDGAWSVVGAVEAKGSESAYRFVDRNVAAGVMYSYRLKTIDRDGSYSVSAAQTVTTGTPQTYALEQNYPNPFNPTTTIRFQLPQASHATLIVYNAIGEKVDVLHNGALEAGAHRFEWDASDLSSGVYLYRIEAGDYSATKKALLLK